jgi:hypothetical protein
MIFVFPPAAAWGWLSLGSVVFETETRADAVTSLAPWTEAALRRRLEQDDKIASEIHCRQLLDVTGGWPLLVDEVFERSRRNPDIGPATAEIQAELDNGGPLARRLSEGLMLSSSPHASSVLNFVRTLEGVKPDEILPDLIDPTMAEHDSRATAEWLLRMHLLVSRGGQWTVDPVAVRLLALP